MRFNSPATDFPAPNSLMSADGPLQRVLLQVTLVLSSKLPFSHAWQISACWEAFLSMPLRLYAVPFLQVESHHKQDPRIHQYAKVSQLCELTVTQKLAWL